MRLAKRRIMQARRRVSIHASVKDATYCAGIVLKLFVMFQSTHL